MIETIVKAAAETAKKVAEVQKQVNEVRNEVNKPLDVFGLGEVAKQLEKAAVQGVIEIKDDITEMLLGDGEDITPEVSNRSSEGVNPESLQPETKVNQLVSEAREQAGDDLQAQSDYILSKYKEESLGNGDTRPIAPDGLLNRGEITYEQAPDGTDYWERVSGGEQEKWKEAQSEGKAIAILTKDQYDATGYDLRGETGRRNDSPTGQHDKGNFFRNLGADTYGLSNISPDGTLPEYPTQEQGAKHYEEAPIARHNLKKQIGESSISPTELKTSVEQYGDYTAAQLILEKPNIILDTTRASDAGISVLEKSIQGLQKFSEGIYYSDETKQMVVRTYHPSARMSPEKIYNTMKSEVESFLKAHPDFIPHTEKTITNN